MALVLDTFQYVPVPVLSAVGREDAASTSDPVLTEVGTGVDLELKGGVYVVGASATVAPVTGTFGTVEFMAGADVVAQVTFPQGSGGRIGGLFMLVLSGTETRRFAWRAASDGSGATVTLSDLHFVVMAIGGPQP